MCCVLGHMIGSQSVVMKEWPSQWFGGMHFKISKGVSSGTGKLEESEMRSSDIHITTC